jgi:hydroxypyruvate isomerase
MRDSVPLSGWSAHLSLLYSELPLGARPSAAARAGFRWVDSWWITDPVDRGDFIAAVGDAGLGLACLNAYAGDMANGDRGFINRREARAEGLKAIVDAAAIVHALGGRTVNVLIGRATCTEHGAEQLESAASVLREASSLAASLGVILVVEHLNVRDVPGYLLPTPSAAVRFIEDVAASNVGLLYDAYHAAMAGLNAAADAAHYVELIGHAQFAEAPGRTAPGAPCIELCRFAETLRCGGYLGPIGLEYDPQGSSDASLAPLRDLLCGHPADA